jgi:predicted enzyme related to lactoylglutathione lyase
MRRRSDVVLSPATRADLRKLMTWFPGAASTQVWGGPSFRLPFTYETFIADAPLQDVAYCMTRSTQYNAGSQSVNQKGQSENSMHKSKLAGFIIDCKTDDLVAAAKFWSAALGCPPKKHEGAYVTLKTAAGEPYVEVQSVDHPSRVHIDIEADDIDAEVERLVALGAREITRIRSWVVLEAPTGQRFCVVPVQGSDFDKKANVWHKK